MNKMARILLVDDDPAIRQVFSELLRSEGFEVADAASGEEGLELTRKDRPDLVLLDVRLPGLSGIEMCRQIKADPNLADVFVVLFSGEATSGTAKAGGLESGADEYLSKTLDVCEFLARIRTIVRLRDTTAALRTREQHYRRLVEILPDAVALVNLQGQLLSVNAQAVALLGYGAPAELLQKTVFDLLPPEEHERIQKDVASVLKSGLLRNAEYTLLRKDGQRFEAELSSTVLEQSHRRLAGMVVVVRDVSERKRAEEQIRLLADAVQSTQEMICLTDQENRFTFINRSFQRTYGYGEEEILGLKPDLLYGQNNPAGQCEHVFEQTLRGGGWKGELINRRKDGTEFPVMLSTSVVKNSNGKILGLMGVARDISERKKAEEELRQFPRRIIDAQEAERQRVARELHDGVNQLIASAKMRLCKVEESIGPLRPAAREILARCDKLLVRALEENRRIAYNLRPSDLDELGLTMACRDLCKQLQSQTGLAVKCHIGRFGQRLPANLELNMFRIVQEAFNNIQQHAEAKSVRLRMSLQNGCLELQISDDGKGFDAGRSAGKRKRRGLGLSNIRERAAALGGGCEVEAGPKQGTTIRVRVPCPEAKKANA